MEKCVSCQFYDRRNAAHNDGKGTLWGQCRRSGPMLHPLNAKSYMVEGVWPHVRDDDWCGEWKLCARRPESKPMDLMSASPALNALNPPPAARTAALSALANLGTPSTVAAPSVPRALSHIGSI